VLGIFRESCPSRVQYVTPLPPVMEPGEVHIPTPVEKHVGGATVFVMAWTASRRSSGATFHLKNPGKYD
jgi:uncharacterized protein YaaQ